MRASPPTQNQQGFALLAVLILSGICLLMIGQITYRHQLDKSAISRSLLQDQTILLALSAESWARQILRDDAESNQSDSLEDDWAQAIPVLPVEGGLLRGCIRDMQSKFNLNNLQTYTADSWNDELASLFSSDLDVFLNLLAILEQDSSELRAAVIVDWTDANSDLIIPGSAENLDYMLESPARLAANRALTNIEELAGLPTFSDIDVLQLYPYATALPGATGVNVNTASAELLTALSSVMDRFLVESILKARPFDSLDNFYAFVADATGYMSLSELREQLPATMLTVSSQYFELLASVTLVGQEVKMRSLMQRNGTESAVFMREFQTVPFVLSDNSQGLVSSFDCYNFSPDENES
jgi:general secretion pathway protein K